MRRHKSNLPCQMSNKPCDAYGNIRSKILLQDSEARHNSVMDKRCYDTLNPFHVCEMHGLIGLCPLPVMTAKVFSVGPDSWRLWEVTLTTVLDREDSLCLLEKVSFSAGRQPSLIRSTLWADVIIGRLQCGHQDKQIQINITVAKHGR